MKHFINRFLLILITLSLFTSCITDDPFKPTNKTSSEINEMLKETGKPVSLEKEEVEKIVKLLQFSIDGEHGQRNKEAMIYSVIDLISLKSYEESLPTPEGYYYEMNYSEETVKKYVKNLFGEDISEPYDFSEDLSSGGICNIDGVFYQGGHCLGGSKFEDSVYSDLGNNYLKLETVERYFCNGENLPSNISEKIYILKKTPGTEPGFQILADKCIKSEDLPGGFAEETSEEIS